MPKNGSYFADYSSFSNNGHALYQSSSKGYIQNDYYPFGMLQPGRSYSSVTSYRYGFNGKENDSKDGLVQYDYGFRIYDPRLARFKSVDPLSNTYPYYTPYQFAGNMPIAAIDIDGLEQYVVIHYKDQKNNSYKSEILTIKAGEVVVDQTVKKARGGKSFGDKIAKGNILVFEVYNEGTRNEEIKLIKTRNKPQEKFTSQEEKIYKTRNKAVERGKISGNTSYSYPSNENQEYKSEDFNEPTFYEAKTTYPTIIKGYTEFTNAGFKTGASWIHAKKETDGSISYSNQLDERLIAAKSDESVTSINITLNIYTQAPYTPEVIKNVERSYKLHASRVTGIPVDKITVRGTMQKGESSKSTVIISTNK